MNYPHYQPDVVFVDSYEKYFNSELSPANQWWQITFSKSVWIESYLIKTDPNRGARPKSWVVNASFDNETWEQVDDVSLEGDIGGNTTPFKLKKIINCLYFRLILRKSTWSDHQFVFSYFDCFGPAEKYRMSKKNYFNFDIISNILLYSLMNTNT